MGMLRTRAIGVTIRVMRRKRSAQSPVAWVMNSMGLAPRFCCHARQPSVANGSKEIRNVPAFILCLRRYLRGYFSRLEVLSKIHARVEAHYLICVAVEP